MKFAPRASKSSRDVERKVDNKNLSRVKFAPRASKSSRDVERKVENKHLNLKSETHAQNRQRGAARDEINEPLITSGGLTYEILFFCLRITNNKRNTEHPCDGAAVIRPQGVLDPPPLAQHGVLRLPCEHLLFFNPLKGETFEESL